MLNNPIHSLQTAALILGIGIIAIAPNPFEVDYLDWVQQQVRLDNRAADATTAANTTAANAPAAVSAIADATARRYGIPKPLIMAIAAHETGNYAAVIGNGNAWGLKCVNDHHTCTTVKTQEYTGGKVGSYRLGFESCADTERCSRILGQTLQNLNTTGQWDDIPRALEAIGRRYATDPGWAAKVRSHLAR